MARANQTSEAEARARRGGRSAASARPRSEREFRVALEHGRWRHFGWAAVGIGAGGFLILQLGAVGKALGAVLALIGVIAAVRFARTLL
ncbi:MAG TPA: hypothetical protein VKZ63_20820, partial [Kofleriaceae bacterium]|nr:hypothetical protein [Kofleriaceae bacterium]